MTIIGSNEWYAQKEVIVFDVETFINDVNNRFFGTLYEESREDLQALWIKVLSMPRGGDASLYPNAHGRHPALLEVWLKACDFWRANGYRKPARLLCDQNGIVIDEETAQKIAAAKATANGTTAATIESEKTPTEAAEAPTDAQADTSGLSPLTTTDTPTEAAETPTGDETTTVSDGSAVGPQPSAEAQEEAADLTADDYDPGVIVPEAAYPAPTPRRRRTSRYRPLPSLFDDCEITDSADAPAETTTDDETATASGIVTTLKGIANNKTAREIAKGVGILAAVAIIYESGLIIPFALLGGLAGGFIK